MSDSQNTMNEGATLYAQAQRLNHMEVAALEAFKTACVRLASEDADSAWPVLERLGIYAAGMGMLVDQEKPRDVFERMAAPFAAALPNASAATRAAATARMDRMVSGPNALPFSEPVIKIVKTIADNNSGMKARL